MTALEECESAPRPRQGPGGARHGRWASEVLITPALILGACAAPFRYLSRQNLDDIERRQINRQVITQRLLEHVELVAVSTVAVLLVALPLGVLLTRPGLRRPCRGRRSTATPGQVGRLQRFSGCQDRSHPAGNQRSARWG